MARVPRVRRRWRLGFWYRFAVAVLWPFMNVFTRTDWRGTEHFEDDPGGIVLAPNHVSWFDPLTVCHVSWMNDRPPRFLAKESLFSVPLVGRLLRGAGQIPVHRETREAVSAVRSAVDAVERGECVVVYPEGTITRDPDLWPMSGKTGAARIALATGRPVIPMAQWGPQDVMGPYRKEFRILPRKMIHVRVGPPVDLSDLVGRPLDSDTLRLATDRIMDAIAGLLAEIRQQPAPAQRYVHRRGSADSTAADSGAGQTPPDGVAGEERSA